MPCPWLSCVAALAQWACNLTPRRDAYGKYIPPGQRVDPGRTTFTEKSEPTEDVLKAHFSGEAVIGLFVIGAEGTCRFGVIDFDRHGEQGSPEANERAAIAAYDRAIGMGLSAFLEASNGRGGYKLWLVFREHVPARWVRRLARWLIHDWKDPGLEREPEIFPKQDELGPGKFGNFVRLPGRHHTFEHWSQIWGRGKWLEGEDAAREILAAEGSPATSMPDQFRHDPPAVTDSSAPAHTVKASTIPVRMVCSAVDALPASFFGKYENWLNVGMSLFDLGDEGLRLWEDVSRKCPKNRPGACREKWKTFKPGGRTYRSLFHWAKQFGWSPKAWKGNGTQKTPPVPDAEHAGNPVGRPTDQPDQTQPMNGSGGSQGGVPGDSVNSDGDGQGPPDNKNGQPSPSGTPRRAQIAWEDRPPPDLTDEALAAYKSSAYPKRLFVKGGVLVRLRKTEEGPRTEELSKEALRGVLSRVADWLVVVGKDRDDKPIYKITPPPWFVVDDILTLPDWDADVFPHLNGIIRCPVIAPDGSLVATPGYHMASRLYYEPDPKLTIPAIPDQPSDEDIAKAKALFFDELLFDFPFKEKTTDRANALAYLLTPFVRSLIKGPTPLGIIDAPVQGTGKGLLAFCLGMVAAGDVRATPMPNAKEEWQKTITALLVSSAQVVLFDNMTGVLYSPDLAAVLTAEVWSARLITTPEMVNLPVTCIWLGTANNLEAKEDMPRRIVIIRLDAGVERPDERSPDTFRHKDLLPWAREHRGELIWAALVLVRAWLTRGRPDGPQNMGSYESWSRTLGGILQVAGVPGFLGTQQTRRTSSDSDTALWRAFCNAWYEKYGETIQKVKDLFTIVEEGEFLLGVLNSDTELGRRQQFGKRLKERTDRVYGNLKILCIGEDNSGRHLYKLEVVGTVAGPGREQDAHPPPSFPFADDGDEYPDAWNLPNRELGSRLFYRYCESRLLHRVYLGDRSAQIYDLCHAIFQCRAGWRLITGRALVRFARSRDLLPGILTAVDEVVQIRQLEECFQEANFYLYGLAEIWLFDVIRYKGKPVYRYGIRDPTAPDFDPVLQPVSPEVAEAGAASTGQSTDSTPFDVSEYFSGQFYETFVDFCRCWWEIGNPILDALGVLRLVHTYGLLSDYDPADDTETQVRELDFLLQAICGFEFEGFLIGEVVYEGGDSPIVAYELSVIEGYPLPPIPPDAAALWGSRWISKLTPMTSRGAERFFRRLSGQA